MNQDRATAVATVIGAAVALLALIKGIIEYSLQGAQKRADEFLQMRKRLKENESFREILSLAEMDDIKLHNVSFRDKRDLLGFFEEIALMANSGIIKEPIAHYMFGAYALRIYESQNFWNNVNRDSIYWTVFNKFAEDMKRLESKFSYNQRKFRF